MKKLIELCTVVALLAVTFMCVVVGMTVLKIRSESITIADNANKQIIAASFTYNAKLQTLSDRADLTWKNLDYLILNAGLTAKVAKDASIKELATLDTLNNGINASVANLNSTLSTTNSTIGKFGRDSSITLADANVVIARLPPMIEAGTVTITSLNKAISNPSIPTTIDNIANMSKSGTIIMQNAADETTKLVHPNKKKLGFWGTLDGAAMWFHNHLLPPLL